MPGLPGADSSVPVTTHIGGQTLVDLARAQFEQPPVFWGRYFSPGADSFAEYTHLTENNILRNENIKLLPIAQQTKNVNLTYSDGAGDAQANVTDMINTFGMQFLSNLEEDIYMFLDVEGAPSLSVEYYEGWSTNIVSFSKRKLGGRAIQPCVYATQGDTVTWNSVRSAVNSGNATFFGAWVAEWPASGCHPLPDWNRLRHIPLPNGGKVLIWQYANDCHGSGGFDCSVTNPNIDADGDLLNHLILPPMVP
jgi:hypothetical protein